MTLGRAKGCRGRRSGVAAPPRRVDGEQAVVEEPLEEVKMFHGVVSETEPTIVSRVVEANAESALGP